VEAGCLELYRVRTQEQRLKKEIVKDGGGETEDLHECSSRTIKWIKHSCKCYCDRMCDNAVECFLCIVKFLS